jgi:uncharacterized protein (TIGR02266 family)
MTVATSVKTVIVADDTAFVRDRFKSALETAGHRAVTVRTGIELLTLLRKDPSQINLVVLDLRLPQGNGVEMVRAIRKLDQMEPPVVVFSGTIADAVEVRALSALGVAGYVNEYTAVQHIVPSLSPHLFPEQYNRRSSPRVSLTIPVAYRLNNTIAPAVTLNVSRGGVAIRSSSPLAVGTSVKIRLRLPGGAAEIEAEARVKWADRRVGMGLEFTTIDGDSQNAIDAFVQSKFFSNRKA